MSLRISSLQVPQQEEIKKKQSPRQAGKIRKYERNLLQYTHDSIDYQKLLGNAQMLGDEET